MSMTARGVTVKVECWVVSAQRHRESDGSIKPGWLLTYACGHRHAIFDGPAPVDHECLECAQRALIALGHPVETHGR